MTTKTDELKPCPFCGCANIHITPDEVGSGGQWVGPVHVVCGGDCVAGQSGDDRESAIAAWNRRAVLQSQDREDAERYRYLITKLQQSYDGDYIEIDPMSLYCHMQSQFKGDRVIRAEITWGSETGESIGLSEAIDHARRIEGADDA